MQSYLPRTYDTNRVQVYEIGPMDGPTTRKDSFGQQVADYQQSKIRVCRICQVHYELKGRIGHVLSSNIMLATKIYAFESHQK